MEKRRGGAQTKKYLRGEKVWEGRGDITQRKVDLKLFKQYWDLFTSSITVMNDGPSVGGDCVMEVTKDSFHFRTNIGFRSLGFDRALLSTKDEIVKLQILVAGVNFERDQNLVYPME